MSDPGLGRVPWREPKTVGTDFGGSRVAAIAGGTDGGDATGRISRRVQDRAGPGGCRASGVDGPPRKPGFDQVVCSDDQAPGAGFGAGGTEFCAFGGAELPEESPAEPPWLQLLHPVVQLLQLEPKLPPVS